MRAISKKYLDLSGRARFPPNEELEIRYLFATDRGAVYLTQSRRASGEVTGPLFLVEREGFSSRIWEYRLPFPERLIGVFSDVGWDVTGPTLSDLRSLRQLIAAPLTRYEDKLRIYLSLMPAPSVTPQAISGRINLGNDGTQFPWWNWSITDVELLDADLVKPQDGPEKFTRDMSPWIRAHGNYFGAKHYAITLLKEDGSVYSGELQPGLLLDDLPVQEEFIPPQNKFQRRYYSVFHSLPENDRALDAALAAAPAPHPSGISITIDLPETKGKTLTPIRLKVTGVGHASGPEYVPHHVLSVEIETLEGFSFSMGFQNNLPCLVGRAIFVGEEIPFFGHVQLGFKGENAFETGMVIFREVPVREGLFRVNDFAVTSEDGWLTDLQADAVFDSAPFFWEGREISWTRGMVRLNLPRNSLMPPWTFLNAQGIRVERYGFESVDAEPQYPQDKWKTLGIHPCQKTILHQAK